MNKKTIAIIAGVSVAGAAVLGICGGFAWKEYNRFEPAQKELTVELGTELNKQPETYIEASGKLLEKTTLDFSGVDINKTGTYTVTAISGRRTVKKEVRVVDTTAPVITLKQAESYSVLVNTELKATDIIEKVEDLSGIKSITFDKNQTAIQMDSENPLDKIGLKFDTAGMQTVKATAEDNNGNLVTKEISIKVIEDYLAHVSGFVDIITEQGTAPDWMAGIIKDEKIAELTADASGVDLNTPGEYILKYVIKGNDNETVLEQSVKVTVTAKPEPEPEPEPAKPDKKSSSSGSKPSSGDSSSSNKPSSGDSSSSNKPNSESPSSGNKPSSGDSSGGGGSSSGDKSLLDGLNPGQSWDITQTGEGTADTGINWESWEVE